MPHEGTVVALAFLIVGGLLIYGGVTGRLPSMIAAIVDPSVLGQAPSSKGSSNKLPGNQILPHSRPGLGGAVP